MFLILLALLYFEVYARIYIYFGGIYRVHFVWKVERLFFVNRKDTFISKISFFKTVTNLCWINCLLSYFLSFIWLFNGFCNIFIFLIVLNEYSIIHFTFELEGKLFLLFYLRKKTVVIIVYLILILILSNQFHFCLFFNLKYVFIFFIFVVESVLCDVECSFLV